MCPQLSLIKSPFYNTECEQLRILEKSNLQREQRIKRVRQKNFHKKEAELSEELSKLSSESLRKWAELETARRQFVNNMSRRVFPIEVESLSERDDGEGEGEREKGERSICICVQRVSVHYVSVWMHSLESVFVSI